MQQTVVLFAGARLTFISWIAKKFRIVLSFSIYGQQVDTLPQIFFADNVADRIQLLTDVYQITKNKKFLNKAINYADTGIAVCGVMTYLPAVLVIISMEDAIGNFVLRLLRIHLALDGTPKQLQLFDWSY